MSEKVIIIHETLWQSYARDAGSFVMVAGMIGLGVFLDSAAMQWLGAILAFIAMLSRGVATRNVGRMTVAEAREMLDEIEAGAAQS